MASGGSGIAICGLDCCGGRGLSTVCAQLGTVKKMLHHGSVLLTHQSGRRFKQLI
jgi:hypothetical protein